MVVTLFSSCEEMKVDMLLRKQPKFNEKLASDILPPLDVKLSFCLVSMQKNDSPIPISQRQNILEL